MESFNKAKDLAAQPGSAETHLTWAPQSAQETLDTDESLKGSQCSVSILSTPSSPTWSSPQDSVSQLLLHSGGRGDGLSPDHV